MTIEITNPYDGLDWSEVEHHKSQIHNHPGDPLSNAHEVIDLYGGDGPDGDGNELSDGEEYTVYGCVNDSNRPNPWPWPELNDIDEDWENRDPENVGGGVVAFPGHETDQDEHVMALFSTIWDGLMTTRFRDDNNREILERDEFGEPEPLSAFAHPGRYSEDWDHWAYPFQQFDREDGLLGLEVFNTASAGNLDTNLGIWDGLLSVHAPDRLMWGFGVDDPRDPYLIGEQVDRGFNTVLLESDDFDPSNQEDSRQAAFEAYLDGRTLAHWRDEWDAETEDPPECPQVNEISVSGQTIEIDATGYDSIEWVSSGDVVGTGDEITVTEEHHPYVRADIRTNPDAGTLTQPFGVDAGIESTINEGEVHNGSIGGTL